MSSEVAPVCDLVVSLERVVSACTRSSYRRNSRVRIRLPSSSSLPADMDTQGISSNDKSFRPSQLVGTWHLVAAEYRMHAQQGVDGEVIDYLGPHPSGMLVYDGENMCVQLMQAGRPQFASGDRLGGSDREVRDAFEGYHAYFGRYTVDVEKRCVVHHIQGSCFPNFVNTDQTRFFKLDDDDNMLQLTTPPLLIKGSQACGVLMWRRPGMPR